MKSLKNFVTELNVKSMFSKWWETHDFSKWIDESYEDYCLEGGMLTESQFYLNKYRNNWGYDTEAGPHYIFWQYMINERLNDSFILSDKILYSISKLNGFISINVENHKSYKFTITVTKDFDYESFNHMMNFYGYYMQSYYVEGDYIKYTFEAIHPLKVSVKSDDYVYHITTKQNYDKILKYGLSPKSNKSEITGFDSLEYPGRIYCFRQNTARSVINSFINLKKQIYKLANKQYEPVILLINLKKLALSHVVNDRLLRQEIKPVFYTDPSYTSESALFTLEPIPSYVIEKISLNNINESKNEIIDDDWINSEKPVQTIDGRDVIVMDIDRKQVPNIIIGKIKFMNKLLDYTWTDTGKCIYAQDQYGNPKKAEKNDDLIKKI